MKSLPIKSDTILDKPKYVVFKPEPGVGWVIFSVHRTIQDAKHNQRVIDGALTPIDWGQDEAHIWEADLYGR